MDKSEEEEMEDNGQPGEDDHPLSAFEANHRFVIPPMQFAGDATSYCNSSVHNELADHTQPLRQLSPLSEHHSSINN